MSSSAAVGSGSATPLDYAPLPGQYDEMRDAEAGLRAYWQPFCQGLERIGLTELMRRWDEARQLIRENGITYNVYGDPRGMDRPWNLDPIPLLVSEEDSARLEAGLVQRARLMEMILADLYGPQHLLHVGLIPSELVFANPGFLRPLHGILPAGGHFLHLYGVNIGRAPDGTLWVLGDRTQAPSGAGYALENRLVQARVLPEVFRDCRVQRLALFFRTLCDTLQSIAPHNRDNPRIVLLTPGPYNETYFEHAFLARYLGYPLVEGGDLTVRDCRVHLKVLGGLQPVDVILRRLDDDYCDSLELRGDSFLGVPGLVEAVRQGNVTVANALGSGMLEMPALLAYLERICQHLLGEPLLIPSVKTWWCGEPGALEHVLAHLDELVIKPTFLSTRLEPIFTDQVQGPDRDRLIERLRARPWEYVGQERLALSTTPLLTGTQLEPRQVVSRLYLTAKEDSFMLMPGGLTRVSASADNMVVSMQRGGGSKDTWFLSNSPVNTFSMLPPVGTPVPITRGGSDLPSRAADNLFWLGRYTERAEGAARLMRGILVRLIESPGGSEATELVTLVQALSTMCQPAASKIRFDDGEGPVLDKKVLGLIFDPKSPNGLSNTLLSLRRIASVIRNRLSGDMWRVLSDLNDFRLALLDDNGDPNHSHRTLGEVLDLLNDTISTLVAFGGLSMESMTRGEGWLFLDMGRRLERCLHTAGLLRSCLVQVIGTEAPLLEALLEVADSAMTYRRRYLGSLQAGAVLDLLLADESNPRSLAFQLRALADDVDRLPHDHRQASRTPEQRVTLAALTTLCLADVATLARTDPEQRRPGLEELLSKLAQELPRLSDLITQNYLSHLQASRHFAASAGEPPRFNPEFA
ncbi:MAG: circularly permuted type 2 ATP-grasp protein [Gemmataceae bacterium]